MNKLHLSLLTAALIILSTAIPVMAAKDSYISYNISSAISNPSNAEEKLELKLTPEQQTKKDELVAELKSNKEITRSKYQEVNTLRKDIHSKLEALTKGGNSLSEEKNARIQKHLSNIKSLQDEMQREKTEMKNQRKNVGDQIPDFETVVKALEMVNALEKKHHQSLDKILSELNEIQNIIK